MPSESEQSDLAAAAVNNRQVSQARTLPYDVARAIHPILFRRRRLSIGRLALSGAASRHHRVHRHRRSQTDTGVHAGVSRNSLTQVTTNHPPAEQWTPPYPTYPPKRSRIWPVVALSGVAALLGAAALVVALTRPTTSGTNAAPATSAPPTYTSAEVAAAHQKLCDVYKLAARSVQIETNGPNPALAAASLANGAVMLGQAVDAAPALAPEDRAAALALANAYSSTNAMGSSLTRDDPQLQAAINDVNAKDARMKAVCGVG